MMRTRHAWWRWVVASGLFLGAMLGHTIASNTYASTGVTVVVPARFTGRDERLGTVAEGKTALLVLADGRPLEDVRNTHLIASVFLRGKYYDRVALDRMRSEAREIADTGVGTGSE